MYIKVQKIKIENLRHAVLHRCEGNTKKKKEIMRKIKEEMKTIGFWKNRKNYATEIIMSVKLPANSRPELIQRNHKKMHDTLENELSQLRKNHKVITQYFYHTKETIDGQLNVHVHCLIIVIDPDTKQIINPTKRKLFQLTKYLLEKYDPTALQKLENALKKKEKFGKKTIYDRSSAPLWICQQLKEKLKASILKAKQKNLIKKQSLSSLAQQTYLKYLSTKKLMPTTPQPHAPPSPNPKPPDKIKKDFKTIPQKPKLKTR